MDDDLPNNTPIIEHKGFNLYLIDAREHCLCLTNDYDTATVLSLLKPSLTKRKFPCLVVKALLAYLLLIAVYVFSWKNFANGRCMP